MVGGEKKYGKEEERGGITRIDFIPEIVGCRKRERHEWAFLFEILSSSAKETVLDNQRWPNSFTARHDNDDNSDASVTVR